MSRSPLTAGVRYLRGVLSAQRHSADSDEQLLHAFASGHDDSAFATLVRRHGPMVMGVCRRVLHHTQDAEDALQATFLVLARNAATLRDKTALSSFLHGTAYRMALMAKRAAIRRRKHERRTPVRATDSPADELLWREVRMLLDEEIARLPEIYRSVFILCCLESVSQAEAARRLGLKEGTVSSRLTAAHKRLQMRLSRRGVDLTALLAAIALTTETAAALPPALIAITIEGAVATTVVALADSISTSLSAGKIKWTMLLLAVSLLGGSGALVYFQRAAVESGVPPAAEKAKSQPPTVPAAKKDQATVTFAGRVLDPDDKPVAGAKLYMLYYTPKELTIPVRAVSDKDGCFRFTVARKDFDQSASARPWDEAIVVARAEGYGLGLPPLQVGKRVVSTDLTLRLPKDDMPITGRILDLQGKPVAGVAVGVYGLFWSVKEDLTAWLLDLKEKKEGYLVLRTHMNEMGGGWMGRDLGKVFLPTVTGADGRFRLRGVGRERVIVLRLQGPSIVTTELFAMTRPGGTIRMAQWRRGDAGVEVEMVFCGSVFEHIAAPCRPIVGVVRDKDTGKPLPGAVVRSYAFARPRIANKTDLHAVADKEGCYRLTGMPKGEGNEIRAEGPDGQPYLMSLAHVPKGFALEPVTVDFQLKRGVWIQGTVTDKVTGKSVHSVIRWTAFPDNPFRKEAPGLTFEDFMWTRAGDNSFHFAALPGRGVVTAGSWPRHYLTSVGADRIKDLNRLGLIQPYNTVVEINPDKNAKSLRCDIVLDPGRTLTGTVVDPDGRPLAGTRVAGLGETGAWEYEPLRTAAFTVVALKPDETRLLQFFHADKHLAGSLVVRGDAKGPLTVKLGPAGTLTGRFVTRDGKKPLADLELFADLYGPIANPSALPKQPDPTIGTFPREFRTDKDGKFRIENLAPGLKYRLTLSRIYTLIPDDLAEKGVTVEAGETKDLGDVTVKPIE